MKPLWAAFRLEGALFSAGWRPRIVLPRAQVGMLAVRMLAGLQVRHGVHGGALVRVLLLLLRLVLPLAGRGGI